MRQLFLPPTTSYAQPYGIQASTPDPKKACRMQFSTTTLVVSTLVAGGVGYGIKKIAPKFNFTSNLYNNLPMPLQYGLPFISAGLVLLPMIALKTLTRPKCAEAQKQSVSSYISLT